MSIRPILPLLLVAAGASAAPVSLTHAGYVLGATDAPLARTGAAIGFSLWSDASSTTARVWPASGESACPADIVAGYFSVVLDGGAASGCGAALDSSHLAGTRFLQVSLDGTALLPRLRLAPLPTASFALASQDTQVLVALLASAGTLNAASNPVDWSRLKNVPAAIAGGQLSLDTSGATPVLSMAGHVAAQRFDGSGAGLTNVPAGAITGIVPVASGGTGQGSFANGDLLVGNGSTGGLSKAQLTAGSGISISNAPGSITISSTATAGALAFVTASANTTAASNTAYLANAASRLTLTLPGNCTPGDRIEVIGRGSGGWTLATAAGDAFAMLSGGTTTSISSTFAGDTLLVVCSVANSEWKPLYASSASLLGGSWNCTTVPDHAGCATSTQYASCKAIRDDTSFNGGDGTYWIAPSGTAMRAYCDMTTDSGGWTLIMKLTADQTFNWAASYWTTANTLNDSDLTLSTDANAKYASFNSVPGTSLMYYRPGTGNFMKYNFADSQTALTRFVSGSSYASTGGGWRAPESTNNTSNTQCATFASQGRGVNYSQSCDSNANYSRARLGEGYEQGGVAHCIWGVGTYNTPCAPPSSGAGSPGGNVKLFVR